MADRRRDLGLLVFRLSGLLLVSTFGWGKLVGEIRHIMAGENLNQAGLAPLIHSAGFPGAAVLAMYVALCESVAASFVALGFLTRISALALTLSMSGAFYVSLRLGEEPLRAAFYLLLFAALALAGAGTWSVDSRLHTRGPGRLDLALLWLRIGTGILMVLWLALPAAGATATFGGRPEGAWVLVLVGALVLLVVVGYRARTAAGALAVLSCWAVIAELLDHQRALAIPMRSAIWVILFTGLALVGPGRYAPARP